MRYQYDLKAELNAAAEEYGFENWREGLLASHLLNESTSVVEYCLENLYLIWGDYDGEYHEICIRWEAYKPLIVTWKDRRSTV